MTTRRAVLAGLAAASVAARTSWADAGSPAFLAAAKTPEGTHALVGLTGTGETAFRLPLPDRGHAAAAHPTRPEAVAFARRPGTFALVIDCRSGALKATLASPPGRHFYGHGAFSADGTLLFTPENDYEAGEGRIGVWDTGSYTRIDEFASHGTGPHDIKLMEDGATLVVANGGIDTHPDAGRAKLNIGVMRPNLAYLTVAGHLLETVELAPEFHKNSIRHLALGPDGLTAFAMQWEGDMGQRPPLLGLHRRGEAPRLLQADADRHRRMENYAGSVALCAGSGQVAISSPRGGLVQVFDYESGQFVGEYQGADVCGLAPRSHGFLTTAGTGDVAAIDGPAEQWRSGHALAWDNHLVPIG